MNKLANEIMKKDIRLLLKNKKLIPLMCVVPVILMVIMPSVLIIVMKIDTSFDDYMPIFGKVFKVSMGDSTLDIQQRMAVEFLLYNTQPVFFAIIPAIMSTIISANSFVGEKENGTLETLFFSPIRMSDIFIAKVKVSLFLSMSLSAVVFVLMCVVLNMVLPLNGLAFFIPNVRWFVMLFIVGLAITILSTTLIIKKSESSNSVEEAQHIASFIVLPIIVFIVGQFRGVILISDGVLIAVSMVLLGVSLVAMKIVSTKVSDYHR